MSDLKTWIMTRASDGYIIDYSVFKATEENARKWVVLQDGPSGWRLQQLYPFTVDSDLCQLLSIALNERRRSMEQRKLADSTVARLQSDIDKLRKRGSL